MEPQRWEQLGSELSVDDRRYRLRRDTVRLPSGRVLDGYFVSKRPDNVVVFAFAGTGAVRVAASRVDDQEEIEVLPVDEVGAALRDGELISAATVAGVYRALES